MQPTMSVARPACPVFNVRRDLKVLQGRPWFDTLTACGFMCVKLILPKDLAREI